ncbi:MAG: PAS domain S-box protein, partial [Dehalococcoidia bacterium]
MKDDNRSKAQLLTELGAARRRIAVLEAREIDGKPEAPGETDSEHLFRILVENSLDAMSIIDPDGRLRYLSPPFKDLMGYGPEEQIGANVLEPVHPDDLDKASVALGELLLSPWGTFKTEVRVQHKDGSWRTLEVLGNNLIDDPAIGGVITSFRDITERKLAEEALKESEAKYSALVEQARDGVAIIQDEVIKFANMAAGKISGYSSDELLGKRFQELIAPAERSDYDQRYKSRMSGEEIPGFIEGRLQRKDGELRDTEATGQLIQYQGRPAYMVAVRDITERKGMEAELEKHRHHLEELVAERTAEVYKTNVRLKQEITRRKKSESALRESEERFRSIVEAMPIPALISRKSDGQILYTNKHLISTFGLQSENISGLKTPDFYHDPADREAVLSTLLEQGHLHNYEVHVQKADGTPFWVLTSVEPMTFEGEQALFSSFYDVTERKEAEEALQQREEHFRALIENSSEVIVVLGNDGAIRYESPSLEKVTGYSVEERHGRSIFDLVHPDDIPILTKDYAQLMQAPGATMHAKLRGLWKDG